jgi:hypothetical protein
MLLANGSKCCKSHLNSQNTFNKKTMNEIEIVSQTTDLQSYEVSLLLDRIRHATKSTLFEKFSDQSKISDDECKRFTGLKKDNFYSLVKTLKSMSKSGNRDKEQALATYLFCLKTGLDYRTISTIFSIEHFQNVGKYCDSARKALITDFLPQNLGVNHLSRDQWVNQNTIMSKQLFNVDKNQLVLVGDGTYIYCQKSANNSLQRQTYSVQ